MTDSQRILDLFDLAREEMEKLKVAGEAGDTEAAHTHTYNALTALALAMGLSAELKVGE